MEGQGWGGCGGHVGGGWGCVVVVEMVWEAGWEGAAGEVFEDEGVAHRWVCGCVGEAVGCLCDVWMVFEWMLDRLL